MPDSTKITYTEDKAMEAIERFFVLNLRMPQFKELQNMLGAQAKSTAAQLIYSLVRKGKIIKEGQRLRLPWELSKNLNVVQSLNRLLDEASPLELMKTLSAMENIVAHRNLLFDDRGEPL